MPRRRLTLRALMTLVAPIAAELAGIAWANRLSGAGKNGAATGVLVAFLGIGPLILWFPPIGFYIPRRWQESLVVLAILATLITPFVPGKQHS